MKKSFLFLMTIVLPLMCTAQGWTQRGADFYGTKNYHRLGWPIKMSADGNTIVMGNCGDDYGNKNSLVYAYQWNGSEWIQKGEEIEPLYENQLMGNSISVSADGNIIAIGCEWAKTAAVNIYGHVEVWKWNGANWLPYGNIISQIDRSGIDVSLNDDGTILAIASLYSIDMYDWNGSKWEKRSANISLGTENSYWAQHVTYNAVSIALNSKGDVIVIGKGLDNELSGKNKGKVLIYKWENNEWKEWGVIEGTKEEGYLGEKVDISDDGNIIAASAPAHCASPYSYNGSMGVYEWKNNSWQKRGNDFIGKPKDKLGTSFDMNSDGTILVIGSSQMNLEEPSTGKTEVYEWKNNSWVLKGQTIRGTSNGDGTGTSVCTNATGTAFAVASPWYNNNIRRCGKVQVFVNSLTK